jgi:hypothetical protein
MPLATTTVAMETPPGNMCMTALLPAGTTALMTPPDH